MGTAHFSDTVKTGRNQQNPRRRGHRRLTIGARVERGTDADWLRKIVADHFPENPEPKSDALLGLAADSKRIEGVIARGVQSCSVCIIDVFLHQETLLGPLLHDVYPRIDVGDFVANALADVNGESHELAQRLYLGLKATAVLNSAPVYVARRVADFAGRAGRPLAFDFDELMKMDGSSLKAALLDLTLLFVDALDPSVQARVLADRLVGVRFMPSDEEVSFRIMSTTLESNHVFDEGDKKSFAIAEQAHEIVETRLKAASRIWGGPAVGAVSEASSNDHWELQVADLAAAVVRHEFDVSDEDVRVIAQRIRHRFHRVLLNDEWIEGDAP